MAHTHSGLSIAAGARAKWFDIPAEAEFEGCVSIFGGFFLRGRPVAVVGGGNTLMVEAPFLADSASKVTVIHRRDPLRAGRILHGRLFGHPNVAMVWNRETDAICGTTGSAPSATHLRLKATGSAATSEVPVDGAFVGMRHMSATAVFAGQRATRRGGDHSVRPGTAETEIPRGLPVFPEPACPHVAMSSNLSAANEDCSARSFERAA